MKLAVAITAAACVFSLASDAHAQKFVKDVTVVAGAKADVACPAGFSKNGQDLNQGAGGDYIYMCEQRTDNKDEALTDLLVINWGRHNQTEQFRSSSGAWVTANSACPGDRIDVDLNKGSGGAFIWFCKKRADFAGPLAGQKLTAIRFVTADTYQMASVRCSSAERNMTTAPSSWMDADDLNNTVGGKFIYGCLKGSM